MGQIKQESFHRKTPSWTSRYRAMNQEHQLGYVKRKTSHQKYDTTERVKRQTQEHKRKPAIHIWTSAHQRARMEELMRPRIREPLTAHTLHADGTNWHQHHSGQCLLRLIKCTPLLVTLLNTPNGNVYIHICTQKTSKDIQGSICKN